MLSIAALAITVALASEPCADPTLGVDVTDLSHRIRKEREVPDFVAGALVRVVFAGGPAARAGIEAGDVIQSVGGSLIQNVCDFRAAIARQRCGEVRFTFRRGRETYRTDAVLVHRDPRLPALRDPAAACRDGDGTACRELADPNDPADTFLRQACDLGDGEACYQLALEIGSDEERSVPFYEQACDAGIAKACTNLGWMYERGLGTRKDLDAALRLYRLGCNTTSCGRPNNLGCVNLGRFYRDGIGVKEDHVEAARLFRMVCERRPADDEDAANIARACSLAGTEMVFGRGKRALRDLQRGRELLEKGCAANDAFGCFNLGVLYEFGGEGVAADRARAATHYRRACDMGDTEACERLSGLNRPRE